MSNERGAYAIAVPVTTAGNKATIITAPCRLCGWSLGDAGFPAVAQALDVAVAAAAAGSLTLTGFLTVSLVRVTPAAAWPAGVNQVTLTNVTGGTQTVDVEGGTDNAVEMLFNPALGTTGTPVVSVPAIVGGPAYTIEAVGTISGGSPQSGNGNANILDGGLAVAVSSPLAGTSDTQWLCDDGIYISTSLIVSVIAGTLSGVLYVRDARDKTFLH